MPAPGFCPGKLNEKWLSRGIFDSMSVSMVDEYLKTAANKFVPAAFSTIRALKTTFTAYIRGNMRNWKYLFISAAIFAGCRKPYDPPAINSPGSYLVVEGTINTNGVTDVKLSETVNLSASVAPNPVTGAVIAIQSSQGGSYPVTEGNAGNYQSASLTLDNSQQYRLSITTNDGQQYLSHFESVSVSPPIDSLGFNTTSNGLQVYVNTHDPTNSTKYYRWDYNETWEFHAEYQSEYITNGSAIVPRTADQNIYYCFANDTGSNIALASTAHLSQAVVNQQVLTTIPSTSEKIESEYSIQVNQYALSGDAYNYWSNLKEDTEDLGSIFDPLPSNFSGNIYNTANKAIPVIGYVSVCAVQTRRIFIANTQLPKGWIPTYPYQCQVDSDYYSTPVTQINEVALNLIPLGSPSIPTIPWFVSSSPNPVGFLATDIDCVDCTLRGTKTVPSYWPPQLVYPGAARRPSKRP